MAKIVLDTITGGYDLSIINNNFDKIETEFQNKVLYRNNPVGEPNTLETDLDANGKRIYNLPEPLLDSQAARLQDVQNAIAGGAANLIPFTPYGHVAGNNVQAAIQELIDDTTNNGVALPAFLKDSNTIVVDNISALKAIDKTKFTKAQVLGYYTKGDGGGGVYWFDPSDTASADNSGTIIVATDLGRWKLVLQGSVSVKQFGAKGDGVTDNATALAAIKTVAQAGTPVHFPYGTYATSVAMNFTLPVVLTADAETRIKLLAAADYVIQFDFTQGGAFYDYGAYLSNFVLDGNGFAVDGLSLKGVISSDFSNIRATNVTRAGLHLWWAQLCTFHNFVCSSNVEAWTTIPVNGLLADTQSSSANTFNNITIEHVSGSGIKGIALINAVFINGTSEGNSIGIEFGETVVGSLTAIGNTVIGMDLEVNSVSDIVLRATASANDFISLKSGFNSPPIQVLSSLRNKFIGGVAGGFNFDSSSSRNTVDGVTLLGAGKTITDTGTLNSWEGVWNLSDATTVPDKPFKRRENFVPPGAGTSTINAANTNYAVISATGATHTVGAPLLPRDGQELDITIHNISGGAIVTTWNTVFKLAGWVEPANGFNRSIRFRYDSNYTFWYMIAMSQVDVPN